MIIIIYFYNYYTSGRLALIKYDRGWASLTNPAPWIFLMQKIYKNVKKVGDCLFVYLWDHKNKLEILV